MDLATGLAEPQQLQRKYNLSDAEFTSLIRNEHFQALLKRCRDEWAALDNGPRRTRMKAAAAAELVIPELVRMAHDPDMPGQVRVAIFSALSKAARLESMDADEQIRIRKEVATATVSAQAGVQQNNTLIVKIDLGDHVVSIDDAPSADG